MRVRRWLFLAVAVLAVVLITGRALTSLVVDHAWYSAMGAPGIFWEQLTDTVLLQGGAWLLGGLFAFANLHAVRRTIDSVTVPTRVANLDITEMLPSRRLLSITIILAVLISFALAAPLTDWTTVALARHGIPFVEREGILDRDIGFYLYQLPLEETAYLWSLGSVVVLVTIVLLLYTLTRSLRLEGRRIVASNHVRRHLSVLGALVLLLLAWSYRLDTFDLLQRGSGPDGLFLRIDHMVSLQADRVLVVICGIAAPILLRAGWIGQVRAAFYTLSLVLAAALGGRQVLPIMLNRSDLIGDPARRDQPYLATRTLFSRRAYAVDAIQTSLPDSARNPHSTVHPRLAHSELAARVSLWEPEASRSHVGESRSLIDVGLAGWTHTADGHVASLSVRRPAASGEPWSVAMTDVTQPTLRDSLIEVSFSAHADDDANAAVEPMVAPGLDSHRLVADPQGVLGAPLRGLGMRVAHAWATRDPSLLDADTIDGAAPRLVAYRDVRTRVRRLAPTLIPGDDVQPIVYDGSVLWAVNLYSASDRFPLSQHWTLAGRERSYFHFAGTALVDAATGRVRIVPVDRPDAFAKTWFAQIPGLIVRANDLPARLLDALPPATEGAIAQTRTFARYGSRMDGTVVRHLPDSIFSGSTPPMHLVASALSEVTSWSVPLVDNGDQLNGVMSAIGGRYRSTYWDSTVVPRTRWGVATDRLRAALDTARASAPEGGRREPRIRMSGVQVIPSVDGPVLIQSLLWNRADGAPVITRVGVWSGGRVALGATLGDALASLRGTPVASRPPTTWIEPSGTVRDQHVARLYEVMRDAIKRGEWARFGAAFDSLGMIVGRPPQ
jgi:uncharacterized membrane protein (UPF0182 family)